MIDVKNRIIKFPRRVISLFFISSVLLIPSCGSENKSSNIALLEEENEKTSRDHAGHNHGGHDHHGLEDAIDLDPITCLLYTSPSPRDRQKSRMPSSA